MKKVAKRIVFTGGGTAGHVFPNFPLIEALKHDRYLVLYIGSTGLEGPLVRSRGIAFRAIMTGKLRRYFSWENFIDFFKVGIGFLQSVWILLRFQPVAIFSKGGFVSVPVCLAGKVLGIPVLAHESDMTPGLATRIVGSFASMLFCAFPETKNYLPQKVPCKVVGIPLRMELKEGDRISGLAFCGFDPLSPTPVLLVLGGSQGSQLLNAAIFAAWPKIRFHWRVIHLTGAGKETNIVDSNYKQFPFIDTELPDLFAAADMVISRAGATSLFELLFLEKPMLLIPLAKGSRGDQILNAQYFAKQGFAKVIAEAELNADRLTAVLAEIWQERDKIRESMRRSVLVGQAVTTIHAEIKRLTERGG